MNSTSAGSGGPPRGPQFDNRRVVAGLIDLVAVLAVAIAVGFVAGFIAGPDKDVGGAMPVLVLAWALFYYFALESGDGQTLGKRIMGLRVLTVDGRHANMGEIAIRTVLRIVDGIGLYVVGLITMIATGQRRQRLGDLAGKTIVTSADWQPAAGAQPPASPAASAASAASAIVLPTAAPAGPELPSADVPSPEVPSPFTPLASDPVAELPSGDLPSPFTPLASDPVADLPSATVDPPSAIADPSPVAPDPVAELPSVTTDPSDVTPAPPPVAAEPPSVTEEPPAVTVDSVEVATTPPAWHPEPEDAATVKDPIVDGPADGTWEAVPMAAPEEPPADQLEEFDADDHVKVRSVETLSAMDLLMSELEDDEPAGHRPAS